MPICTFDLVATHKKKDHNFDIASYGVFFSSVVR